MSSTFDRQPWQDPAVIAQTQRLIDSFRHWTGRELVDCIGKATPADQARALFDAPFVVVADGLEPDPVLNYGNKMALALWEMDWTQLTRTPSRQTAEPGFQPERAQRMAQVAAHGFIDTYSGVRISSSGRRFMIEKATVWVVIDSQGNKFGKAATFAEWRYLPA